MNLREMREHPDTRQILEERAQLLARHVDAVAAQVVEEILIFRLGLGRYGFAVRLVHEVQVLPSVTPLPGTPSFVLGLVNIRGRLLTLLDIRPLLGLPPETPRPGALLLIVGAAGIEVGLVADEVIEVAAGETNIAPSLGTFDGHVAPWVHGIDRSLTVRLDLTLLLADVQLMLGSPDTPTGQVS